MKTKMKKKKLVLKKITIAQLDKEDMNQAKGGTHHAPSQVSDCIGLSCFNVTC